MFLSGAPKGLPVSLFLIYATLEYEKAFNIQRYEINETWFFVLFFLIFLEAALILFWTLLSFVSKEKERVFNKRDIFYSIRKI